MLNNLQLTQPFLSTQSPLRKSLVHLNISGCQSINKSAIDIFLRLSHSHLLKLQRIEMAGLRLELCQQAAKSFLREKLGKLDSLGTMGAFTLGQGGGTDTHTFGQDLSAKHLTLWLKEDSRVGWEKIYQATNICNHFPGGGPVTRQSDNPSWAVPFHHSANLFNMPQTGMFRMEDGTLRVPKWNRTLSGAPLEPELEALDAADFPQIATPWSDNETRIMHLLFPHPDSLCLTFGRTAVFQWNDPNSSALRHTTEWPQRIAGDLARRNHQGGITNTKIDSQPQMPYVIFRNMSPHFDSHANSGIPGITGLTHRFHSGRMNTDADKIDLQSLQLLDLLPHLKENDVATWMEARARDLQTLARAIMNRTGRSSLSSPNHSTTQRLTQLTAIPLQQERRQFGITAATAINILCKIDPPDTNKRDEVQAAPSTDYLGYPIGQPGCNGVDTWGHLNRSETVWGAIQSKTQAHKLINLLCDLVPTHKKLHMPNTTTEIGLRAAKTLAMRGLGLRDSIQLVTWLHCLPIRGAKDFLALIQDSPRATVIHILEGCEHIRVIL